MIIHSLQQESTFTSSAISPSTFGGHRIGSARKTSFSDMQTVSHRLSRITMPVDFKLHQLPDFVAIPFGIRYAVFDPVLSLWPFSQIPLHRLRLDLLYPESLFRHCPSRRRGQSEGTVHGSPLLRVFKQKQRISNWLIFSQQKDWLNAAIRTGLDCPFTVSTREADRRDRVSSTRLGLPHQQA